MQRFFVGIPHRLRCHVGHGLWMALLFSGALHAATATGNSDSGADDASTVDFSTAAVEFSANLLQFPVDVSLFTEGNALPAGNYRVDIATNGEWKGRTSVRFAMVGGNARVAQPCFDLALLDLLGFDPAHLDDSTRAALTRGDSVCRPLSELFEGASAQYSSGEMKLNVSAPQIVLRREARGYVDPSLWENGITAGLLDYSYNAYHRQNAYSGSQTSHYLSLRAGLNLGAWRLRYHATANRDSFGGTRYHGNSATLERGITRLKSRLTLGDTHTDGQVFDSVRLRGVRLDSDERMRPDSQRGFAPVVRGIAQSNAMVSISQLGQEIYQTNVPPGPFVIDDLYPTGMGGDLLVTITESDGSVHTFTIAYAGTAELVRPGTTYYTLAAGQYDNGSMRSAPNLVMGNVRHGLSNSLTGYTGLMVAEGYSALSGGLAFNLPIGALATDITFANTRTRLGNYRGSSVRATWAKILPVIGTNVSVASYRYSSQGYYDPSAAFMLREQALHGMPGMPGFPGIPVLPGSPVGLLTPVQTKNRLVINASQSLPGRWGYLNLSASSQDYWSRDGRDTQYQLGWNRQLRSLSLGLSASRTHNVFWNRWDNQYMLNLSMPLGGTGMYANSSYTQREDGQSLNASMSGSAGAQRQFGYGVFINADDRDGMSANYGGGANASWNASKAQLSANLSVNRGGQRQYGVSLNGGLVAFGGGIILTQRLGETVAIVEAKGAAGARLENAGHNVRLNRRGQAVVSNMQAYRQNQVGISPQGLSTDIALVTTSRQIAPTAGAVALVKFETEQGYSILLRGLQGDGSPLPFAAEVRDADGRTVGHISQGGQALLRVHAPEGTLNVRWGQAADQQCQLQYKLDEERKGRRNKSSAEAEGHDYRRVGAVCNAGGVAAME